MHSVAHRESPSSAIPANARADAAVPRCLSERHYTIKEVAALWNLSRSKVRGLFESEPDVFRDGKPTRKIGSGTRRAYFTTRIPETSLQRIHRRLTGQGWYGKLAFERHFTPHELATAWALSPTKVRRIFAHEGGVLRIGERSRWVGRKLTRRMYTLRMPETVARRVYERRLSGLSGAIGRRKS